MSSTVINTQSGSTAFINAPTRVDPFNPSAPASIGAKGALKKWISQASTNAPFAFSKWVEILLPNDTHLVDVSVEFILGALTTGNYGTYPAMSLISQVQLLDGSEVLHQYDYAEVIKYVLAIRSDNERNTLLSNAGSTAFASGTCKAPIPLFFTRWIAQQEQKMPYFAAHKLKNRLKLRLLLRAASEVAAAGATVGTPTIDGNFYIWTADVQRGDSDPDANWNTYQSYDFEDNIGTVVPTATATNVICDGFGGNVAHLSISNVLATDLSTAHAYLVSKPCTALKLQVNSDTQYYQADAAVDADYDLVALGMSYGDDSTLGQPLIIPIGVDNDPRVYSGSLNMRDVQQLRVNITHTQGANTQCQVLAIKNALYKIENGHLRRYLY